MTDEEVKALALRIYRGEVFIMPLCLMDDEARKALAAKKPGMLYADMSKALARSINGYPMFMECSTVSQPDTRRVLAKLDEIKSAMEKL